MSDACTDTKCYRHGTVRVRGGRMQGRVVSAKAKNTVIVERPLTQYFSKYKRWARRRSHIVAHNPVCIDARVGDNVEVGETRRLSRTKAWTVIQVVTGETAAKYSAPKKTVRAQQTPDEMVL